MGIYRWGPYSPKAPTLLTTYTLCYRTIFSSGNDVLIFRKEVYGCLQLLSNGTTNTCVYVCVQQSKYGKC